jgi:hypothetical protein
MVRENISYKLKCYLWRLKKQYNLIKKAISKQFYFDHTSTYYNSITPFCKHNLKFTLLLQFKHTLLQIVAKNDVLS